MECRSVTERKRLGRPAILTEAKLAEKERIVQSLPSKSLGKLSAQSAIPFGSALKAMKKLHLRTCHVHCVRITWKGDRIISKDDSPFIHPICRPRIFPSGVP